MRRCSGAAVALVALLVAASASGSPQQSDEAEEDDDGQRGPNLLEPPNSVKEVHAVKCTADGLWVRVTMRKPFRGLIFARGFPHACRSAPPPAARAARPIATLDIALPAAACGVRLEPDPEEEGGLRLRATLEVQLDARLRQAADSAVEVQCRVPRAALETDMATAASSAPSQPSVPRGYYREGRGRGSSRRRGGAEEKPPGDEEGEEDEEEAKKKEKKKQERVWAWMELKAENGPPGGRAVAVGDMLAMRIRAHVPQGVGVRAVACVASDGAGEATQRLLDDEGCPEEEEGEEEEEEEEEDDARPKPPPLLPPPRPPPPEEWRPGGLSELRASFPAFKFPERDALHVRCDLQLCRQACPPARCDGPTPTRQRNASRTHRAPKGEPGELLHVLEVFNSVQVLAPGIELDPRPPSRPRARLDPRSKGAESSPKDIFFSGVAPGERALCLPASRLALAFGLLGLLFLSALAVAAYSLLRARRRRSAGAASALRPASATASASAWSGSWDTASAHHLLLLAEEPSRLGPPRQHWAAR